MALIKDYKNCDIYYVCDNCGDVIEDEFYRMDDKHFCKNCVYLDSVDSALDRTYDMLGKLFSESIDEY